MATQLATTEDATNLPAVTPEGERFTLRQRQARMFAMSPLVPEHLRKGSADQAIANCWIALTMAEAMGEQPLILMQNIHVVSGKAGFAAQYMIARANASGKFKDDIDWDVTGKGKELSATCFATLAKSGKRVEFTVDMQMAEAEGWTKNPKYRSIPELMLRYRSATFLIRLYAPEVMLGYQTVEEVEDIVAATAPSTTPLTAKMLTDQAQSTEELPPHDTDTGELVEVEAEEESAGEPDTNANNQADDRQETLLDAVDQGQAAQSSEDPAAAKANEIIAEIKAATSIAEVTAIWGRNAGHIEAMEELRPMLVQVKDARLAEIKATPANAEAAE